MSLVVTLARARSRHDWDHFRRYRQSLDLDFSGRLNIVDRPWALVNLLGVKLEVLGLGTTTSPWDIRYLSLGLT